MRPCPDAPKRGARLDQASHDGLIAAIDRLAFAAPDWPAFLEQLGRALGCHYAAAVETTPGRDAPRSLGAFGITAEDHDDFLRTWHKRNIFGTRRPARQAGAILPGRAIVPRAELERSDMFRAYLAPRAIEEILRLDIVSDPARSRSISLARPWSTGPFSAREIRFVHSVMPHLQRATAVQLRLEDAASVARCALSALELAPTPSLLLDAAGRIVHTNTEAGRLLREADGISAGPAGLLAAKPALTARLAAITAQATGRAGLPAISGALRLPRPSGRPDLTVIAMPLPPRHVPAGTVLQILDPLARPAPDPALLASAFDLTPAEASLAADLARGLTVAEAAQSGRRSIATIRTHLASILAKTGTTRQSDLMRLLMALPRPPTPE